MQQRTLILLAVLAGVGGISAVFFVTTFTFHDPSAIGFGASLNVTTVAQGQAVRVNLADWNTLDFKNSLPLSDGSRTLNLSSGPCGGLYPGGIAIYEGVYGLSNVSSAEALAFYGPGFYGCPVGLPGTSFNFAPHQNITAFFDLAGYYTSGNTPTLGGGVTEGVLHPYLPGVYTVITGDPLGHTKVMYFHVTGTTGNQERTGPVSIFPAAWLPCNGRAAGNTTTGVYLGLNGSSFFDHINLDQAYTQIINSSTFVYHTIGHGWVVSEWTESEAPDNASVGQVIVSFIVTSNGIPSSYADVHYDPTSETAIMTVTPAQGTSCSG